MPKMRCASRAATSEADHNRAAKAVAAMLGVLLGLGLFGKFLTSQSAHADDVAKCTARGIAYFQENGAFPKLSDGTDARTVAGERCARTTTAF